MVSRVLIIGGYGNFGSYIADRLADDAQIQIIIGGRSEQKAKNFAESLGATHHPVEWSQLDYTSGLANALADIRADIVIHTSGPFQNQNYDVAQSCIEAGCHYIDLADARDFVSRITTLDAAAKSRNVSVVSGASSVPCLGAAVIDHYVPSFERLEDVEYGIATAQQTNRGLATTSAVLSYAGRPFETRNNGHAETIYGWQGLHARRLPEVGKRWFGNCDVPDLALFPDRYPDLRSIRFYAGLEVPIVHWGLWLMSWLVRFRTLPGLERLAPLLLKISRLFDLFGSDQSAFFMHIRGKTVSDAPATKSFNLVARSGDGPYIPCAPAIILARQLARHEIDAPGAFPCVGFIDLETYLKELSGLDISWSQDPV